MPRRLLRWIGLLIVTTLASAAAVLPALATPWPGGAENSISISGASSDLSGATWNPVSESLWVVRQNRQVWEYSYDSPSSTYTLVQTVVLPSGIGSDIEAVAQVDPTIRDELYTLDEDNGRIARTIDVGGTPIVLHTWNLEVLNNGNALPAETNLNGAEALEFVPDADLLANGFRYPDGKTFSGSTKGMGGLFFVGHQISGRLHVFDVNPGRSEDFINHGSFSTSANEIAALHFDRTSGLMLVWHNTPPNNTLEISTLSSDGSAGKIDTLELYDTSMPTGNLEGLAVVGRGSCGRFGSANDERSLFFTSDGVSPYLVYYDQYPCDCTGSANETEFDACFVQGDLSGGCSCLDQDTDGDIDCGDFMPPLAQRCVGAPVPTIAPSTRALLGLILMASAIPLIARRILRRPGT